MAAAALAEDGSATSAAAAAAAAVMAIGKEVVSRSCRREICSVVVVLIMEEGAVHEVPR